MSKHLGVIGYYCKKKGLPPLNAIVVNEESGIPGDGVVETEGFKRDQKDVWNIDWFLYRPPSVKALKNIYDDRYGSSK